MSTVFGSNPSRRAVLRGGLAAGALGLAGCQSGSSGGDASLTIPDLGAEIPGREVSLRVMDNGDNKKIFWNYFVPAYERSRETVTIKYSPLPGSRMKEVIKLGFRNGTAPDLFRGPGIGAARMVDEGWVAALDDHIPNFADWKAAFPPSALLEGIEMFDGKVYRFPLGTNRQNPVMLLYNTELLEKAGYDPSGQPATWDELRRVVKKITQQGNGQVYGLALDAGSTGRMERTMVDLAHIAGAPQLNFTTGEYNYTADEYLAVVELLLAMKADGSLFPGASSLKASQAWARVARGNAGMVFGGSWVMVSWQQSSPGFEYGVAPSPVPGGGSALPLGRDRARLANALFLNADCKAKAVGGDVLAYLGSPEGQLVWDAICSIGKPSLFADAAKNHPELAKRARSLAEAEGLKPNAPQAKESARICGEVVMLPAPEVRNPDVALVNEELVPPSPSPGETVQGILTGQLSDPKKALKDLKDRHDRAVDDAIAAARKKGANVSRDDWVFPNWDPTRDYTKQDYEELG